MEYTSQALLYSLLTNITKGRAIRRILIRAGVIIPLAQRPYTGPKHFNTDHTCGYVVTLRVAPDLLVRGNGSYPLTSPYP